MSARKLQVLFTGYAPVHFVCFMPLFRRLIETPGVDVFVAGGLREKTPDGPIFDPQAMYRPFGVPEDRILTMDQIAARDFDLLFAGNTKMLEPRSVGAKIQIFHGISFRNRAIRKENLGADHFFLAGPYMRRKFDEAGLLDAGDPRGLPIGFLKTDRLIDGSLDRTALLDGYGFDGSRPVVLYAPTGQKHCSLHTDGPALVRELAAAGDHDVIVKLHDHPHGDDVNWAGEFARMENDHLRLADTFDVTPLLFLADLLVTDASSVSSEYSLLDRPMVFLDVPKLLAKAAGKDGSMMDMITWGRRAGYLASNLGEAVAAVEQGLANPQEHSELRREMSTDLFYNPGAATDSALRWLDENFLRALAAA